MVDLPVGGRWYLWIRALRRHNSNSFYLYDPDHPDRPILWEPSASEQWLWDGPVRLELPQGGGPAYRRARADAQSQCWT